MSEQTENKEARALRELQESLNSVADRLEFAQRHGLQFGGDRDVYEQLGYDKQIDLKEYFQMYKRQDIAGYIVDKAPETTWKKPPSVDIDGFEELAKNLSLWSEFTKLDKNTRLGHYGVLVLGYNDGRELSEPVDESQDLDVNWVRSFPEIMMDVEEVIEDKENDRYGLPKLYEFQDGDDLIDDNGIEFNIDIDEVHWHRAIHVTQNNLVSEVFGLPTLQRIYNRLQDLQKIVGPTAEAFWKEIDSVWDINVSEEANVDSSDLQDLQDKVKKVVHGLQRVLAGQGREIEKITADINDPTNPFEVLISLIASSTVYSVRQLRGSERGDVAEKQDRREYLSNIEERRTRHADPNILRKFVDRMLRFDILSGEPGQYDTSWPDLVQLSAEEKAEVAAKKAKALKDLIPSVTNGLLPEEKALEMVGVDPDSLPDTMNQNTVEELEAMIQVLEEKVEERNPQTNGRLTG